MPRTSRMLGAILGAATAAAVVAISYAAHVFIDLPFVAFDLFDAMARLLPGPLITFGIDLIVSIIVGLNLGDIDQAAKLAEQTMAVVGPIVGGAAFGALLAHVGRESPSRLPLFGLIGGAIGLALTLAAEAVLGFPPNPVIAVVWLTVLLLGWGWLLGHLVRDAAAAMADAPEANLGRREFLALVGGGLVSVVAAALGFGTWRRARDAMAEADAPEIMGGEGTSGPAASPPEPTLEARIEPAPGTRPEVTPNPDFYRIDINTSVPEVDDADWRLRVDGMVRQPLDLTLQELRDMPSQTQVVTMSCISNRIGGDLIGTSRWTGVRLMDVLERAELRGGVSSVFIESVDGFFESVSMEDIEDPRTILVYDMNGVPLPDEHGFPLRIYIPNRYGMKQPKWIERISAVDEHRPGYWVERGWSEEARPNVVSQIDDVSMDMMAGEGDGQEVRPVGGIAWAGSRGIQRVEVQVDDGPWEEAQLREPALSPLAWVQWRYDWPYEPGRHTFRVRATDGDGAMQVLEPSGVRPDGATGVDELTTTV